MIDLFWLSEAQFERIETARKAARAPRLGPPLRACFVAGLNGALRPIYLTLTRTSNRAIPNEPSSADQGFLDRE